MRLALHNDLEGTRNRGRSRAVIGGKNLYSTEVVDDKNSLSRPVSMTIISATTTVPGLVFAGKEEKGNLAHLKVLWSRETQGWSCAVFIDVGAR